MESDKDLLSQDYGLKGKAKQRGIAQNKGVLWCYLKKLFPKQ
jgi:hypothetical protein